MYVSFLLLKKKINNKRLKLGKNRRDAMKDGFSMSSNYIVELLVIILKHLSMKNKNLFNLFSKIDYLG
jgi:hypothetical protein